MNEKILVSLTFSLFITCSVNADELVPATSEDVSDFERLVTNQALSEAKALHPHPADRAKKENFGQIVSTEAKRLKDASGDSKREMGRWVSEQRRKDVSNDSSASAEARDAAPGRKSHGRESRIGRRGESKK